MLVQCSAILVHDSADVHTCDVNAPRVQKIELLSNLMLMQEHMARSLPADPLDPEYQRRMMEHINQQNIDANYTNAMCASLPNISLSWRPELDWLSMVLFVHIAPLSQRCLSY